MDAQVKTLVTSAFEMDYIQLGCGPKALVVIPGLHIQSITTTVDEIAQSYQLLANNFTVYLLEPRKNLPKAYTVQQMAQDAEAAIRALGLGRVSLYGISQGGMVSQALAIEAPDLVEKLALCSTAARMTDAQYQVVAGWVQLAKARKAQDLYLAFGKAIYTRALFEQSQELLLEAAASVTDADLDRFVGLAQALKGFDVADKLDSIACPVLYIVSADDTLFSESDFALVRTKLANRPDFEYYCYDGYGHAVFHIAPDLKERLLAWFM